jgi:hypothetical protein
MGLFVLKQRIYKQDTRNKVCDPIPKKYAKACKCSGKKSEMVAVFKKRVMLS